MTPARVCSLLPSATEIVWALGCGNRLVGVTDECRWPPEVVGLPVVSTTRIDAAALGDAEIDRLVRESTGDGHSLYAVDAELLDRVAPDLIVTQDMCHVCAVASGDLATACPVGAEILSLDPRTLEEVARSIETLGERLGATEQAHRLASEMRERIESVAAATAGLERPRVFVAEWLDPPFCGGHWVPEMVEAAGGEPLIGRAGEPAFRLTWEEVAAAQPDLIVLAPCGFGVEEAARRAAELALPCRAVAVDGDAYWSRPGPRLADGIEQLAHLLHAGAVHDPGLPALEVAGERIAR